LLPEWRNRLLTEITPDNLRALCGAIVNRGAPATAIHVGIAAAGCAAGVEVAAGQVVLTGPMVDARYITEAVRLVQAVEGVTSVESRIVPLGFHPAEPL
jgi:hypothetical protein